MSFHVKRYRDPRRTLYNIAWQRHDDSPLPALLNKGTRHLLYLARRIRHHVVERRRAKGEGRKNYDFSVPRDRFLQGQPFTAMRLDEAKAWFERVHDANEGVYRGDGSWSPQPYSGHAGLGVPIEEIALRILGYLGAYRATDRRVYGERAHAAADYLLRERVFADGHLLLQGHLALDWGYTLAGVALLALWEQDRQRSRYFDAARKIGDRLLEAHTSGSINHGSIPAQLLGPLYRFTGDARYLKAALRRLRRRAVAFQLPSGDWDGHEGRIWYQGVNLKSLVLGYVATPFSLDHVSDNDRLAAAIYAAANWFTRLQDHTGAIPLTRAGDWSAPLCEAEVVVWNGIAFERHPLPEGYLGHGAFEIDGLITLYERLEAAEILPTIHGYASRIARTNRLWRLEFNTLGAGRYLELVAVLGRRDKATAMA